MFLLELEHIEVYYGPSHVLFDVSLALNQGEAVGLLGRNGAGKSTTMKSIMGLVPAQGGIIRFKGQNIMGMSPYQVCRLGLGYVPEERRIFAGLTVWENLEIARRRARRKGQVVWDTARIFQLFPVLECLINRKGGTLSGGEQQMLCIARALMGNPELLLLDEPSEGLAPLVVQELQRQLQNLKVTGVTLLLSEQNFKFTTQVVNRVYIIEIGQIKYENTPQELEGDVEIRRQYLTV